MADKRLTLDELVGELRSGMTIGVGGWGSRRKPMAAVRAILRSDLTDLTVVSYGGPDVGLLCAAGKVSKVVFGFVTLDSIPTDPHFRVARQTGAVDAMEVDEGMFYLGLLAAAQRVPFLPTRAGLGSDVLRVNPSLRTVTSPYDDGEELVAMPALRLDAALIHVNRADASGSGQILGPDPFFDELFLGAADRRFVTTERLVATGEFLSEGPIQTMCISRLLTDGVVETPGGAHFTACVPDYNRDEAFQKAYVAAAGDPETWSAFSKRYLEVDEGEYQAAVKETAAELAAAKAAEKAAAGGGGSGGGGSDKAASAASGSSSGGGSK
jgi:glutaconate CoA-transferase, subunit A